LNFPPGSPAKKKQSKSIPKLWARFFDIAAADNTTTEERRHTAMNNYEVPEVVEMGKAQDVILGLGKLLQIVFDSPSQPDRDPDMNDDE
jgi:hypothetical protein